MSHPSFHSSREKFKDILLLSRDGVSWKVAFQEACREYNAALQHILRTMITRTPSEDELRKGGFSIFDREGYYGAKINCITIYEFRCKAATITMVGKRQSGTRVSSQLAGAEQVKINGHEWIFDSHGILVGPPLRLGMSGEGSKTAAQKYRKTLDFPPDEQHARRGR